MSFQIPKKIAFILAVSLAFCASAQAQWNPETKNWQSNASPMLCDWGFDRPGYPNGLYIQGITVKEGASVTNAVIYDNDIVDDVLEDEWAFVMASLGKMNLKGYICTPVLTDEWGLFHEDTTCTEGPNNRAFA